MQIPSASVLSHWPAPNYTNPVTRGPAAIIIVSVLLFLVTALLAIRVYTRLRISKGFGLDDVLILLAYVPTAAFAIVSFVAQVDFGWGRHVWDVPLGFFTPSLQLSLASQLLFDLSTTLTKLSMLSLIYRVVSVDNSRYRYMVIGVAAFVSLDGLIFFILVTFQCSPISAYWTLSTQPQMCINQPKHLLAAGCINTITDLIIVIIPIPYVRRLKLPRKQQVIVSSLFAGGVFVTAAGAVRTAVTFMSYDDPNQDLTWNSIYVLIASAFELHIGIICASIPSIKPFFARYLPEILGISGSWLSRNSHSRLAAEKAMSQEALDPDFWHVTYRASIDASDVEAPPLVMQMRGQAPMPGMPTPTRPPRTQSTLRTFSILQDSTQRRSSQRSDTPTSMSTTSTSILGPRASMAQPPDLNKPLPTIRSNSVLDSWSVAEGEGEGDEERGMSNNVVSVYQFVPHEDGHISVYKTEGDGRGG